MVRPVRFDVVLEDGTYLTGLDAPGGCPAGRVHRLRLTWPYRLPLLGVLLRNHWAKRQGARL